MPRLIAFFAAFLVTSLVVPTASAQAWGCYDPKPGHPTVAERRQFIDSLRAPATQAERVHGVPAAAIAAMALVESGYGWTRIALDANNFFGWKYFSAGGAFGRDFYTLTCQPPEDIENRYIRFRDLTDSVMFVASRMETMDYYRSDTQAYRTARAAGADTRTATIAWVDGISNPYNWRPAEYLRTVTRIMNNPMVPSDSVHPTENLYAWSEPISAQTTSPSPMLNDPLYAYAFANVQPWRGACGTPILDYPNWEGFPVRLCTYEDIGLRVQTYMLNPDRPMLTQWIVTACTEIRARDARRCVDVLIRQIQEASSRGIFPVSGFIPEPQNNGGCFYFRDGVTSYTQSYPRLMNGRCPTAAPHQDTLTRAMTYARIASTTRKEYRDFGGAHDVGTGSDPRWPDAVREEYQRAWGNPRNLLISAKARALMAEGRFR